MDIQYLLFLQNLREVTGNVFSDFFGKVTKAGEDLIPYLIALAIYWCFSKRTGIKALLTAGLALLLNGAIKLTASAYRPWIRSDAIEPFGDAKITATGYSFPSGHSMNATSLYGSLARDSREKKQNGVALCLLILILLIMFSRNFLGVHTPQDVLVGFAVTIPCIYLINFLYERAEKSACLDWILLICSVVLAAAAIFFYMNKSYPMDYTEGGALLVDPIRMQKDSFRGAGNFVGIFAGWVVERRFIRFSTDIDVPRKIVRFMIGMLIYVLLYYVLNMVMPLITGETRFAAFIGGFVTFFTVMALYPMAFNARDRRLKER